MEHVFLQSILEQPDDDMARLAYADWLMERGDPAGAARGEFIQIQCQLARREGTAEDRDRWAEAAARTPELQARAQALLDRYGAAWAAPVRGLVDAYEFRRGFVECVTLSAQAFLAHAQELVQRTPLRHVHFTYTPGAIRTLAGVPQLARLTGLGFRRNFLGTPGVRILLESGHLKRVTSLDLSSNHLTDSAALLLAHSPVLASLTELNLSYNNLTVAGVRALTGSPHWGRVRKLDLAGNPGVDAHSLRFLGDSLAGQPDPALLRVVLEATAGPRYEYSNPHVRALAERARANPAEAVAVLNDGLRDSRRKVRAAAAQMLSRLGPQAAPGLPGLVQRLYEHNAPVRAHVAMALARLLPALPAALQEWLCVLANPLIGPGSNLRVALESPRLPESVRRAFAVLCGRRAAWHTRNAGRADVPVHPDPSTVPHDVRSVCQAVQVLALLAEQAAFKHQACASDQQEGGQTARAKEFAWLLARLCELLQVAASVPPGVEEPKAERAAKKRGQA
jgi:uncharacterized protein (TIGR02996 family)